MPTNSISYNYGGANQPLYRPLAPAAPRQHQYIAPLAPVSAQARPASPDADGINAHFIAEKNRTANAIFNKWYSGLGADEITKFSPATDTLSINGIDAHSRQGGGYSARTPDELAAAQRAAARGHFVANVLPSDPDYMALDAQHMAALHPQPQTLAPLAPGTMRSVREKDPVTGAITTTTTGTNRPPAGKPLGTQIAGVINAGKGLVNALGTQWNAGVRTAEQSRHNKAMEAARGQLTPDQAADNARADAAQQSRTESADKNRRLHAEGVVAQYAATHSAADTEAFRKSLYGALGYENSQASMQPAPTSQPAPTTRPQGASPSPVAPQGTADYQSVYSAHKIVERKIGQPVHAVSDEGDNRYYQGINDGKWYDINGQPRPTNSAAPSTMPMVTPPAGFVTVPPLKPGQLPVVPVPQQGTAGRGRGPVAYDPGQHDVEGKTGKDAAGKPMIFRGGKWQYQ